MMMSWVLLGGVLNPASCLLGGPRAAFTAAYFWCALTAAAFCAYVVFFAWLALMLVRSKTEVA